MDGLTYPNHPRSGSCFVVGIDLGHKPAHNIATYEEGKETP
jgi:hypothetical protein